MTTIPIQPISLKTARFTIFEEDGSLDYSTSVGQVVFIPSVVTAPMMGWDGRPIEYVITSVSWSMTLSYAQDLSTPESLMNYILARFGERRTVTFTPEDGGGLITAEVMLTPGQIGGVPGQPLSATVSLPLYGDPVTAEVSE